MQNPSFILGILCTFFVLLSGFKTNKGTSSNLEKKHCLTEDSIKLSLQKAASYCYIKKIIEKENTFYVIADFVWLKDVDYAGGYEIVNHNPKLRTFTVSKDIRVYSTFVSEEESESFLKSGGHTYNISGIKMLLENNPKQLFYIKAKEGKIYHFIAETMAG